MAAALARGIAMLIVIIQSYFNWGPDTSQPSHDTSGSYSGTGHFVGLVLARAGSKGIPHKNMVDLNGQPLIYWALNAMVQSGAIWVSTDDSQMTNWLAKAFPGKVKIHKRQGYTATDEATSITAVQEFLSYHPEVDSVGLVQATSPLIESAYLIQAATLLRKYDSVFSATRSHHLRWLSVPNPDKEITFPLNFDPKSRPRRQDWDGEMIENGMFYFTRRDILMNFNVFQGSKCTYVEIPKHLSIEVDVPEDLEIARYFMKKYINVDVPNRIKIEL